MTRHLKPLYSKAHIEGGPANRSLVDNGTTLNIFPSVMMMNIYKNDNNLIMSEVTLRDIVEETITINGVLQIELIVDSNT